MQHLLESVRSAIQARNWYAALGVALALPDICGQLEDPTRKSKVRYIDWFNAYLAPHYTRQVAGREHHFLSGEDCYALRCAYLHEGEFDIAGQSVKKVLESFVFVAPQRGLFFHLNQADQKLQLQVDTFCEELCVATEVWLNRIRNSPHIQARICQLPQIITGTNVRI